MKKNTDKLTSRAYELKLETRAEEEGVIEGYPIVFGKETIIHDIAGDFKEIIERGALDKADLKDVLLCVNHDTSKIALARTKNGKGTMSLEIREEGLFMRAKLDLENNPEARAVYSAIKRGDLNGMSFMFRVKKDNWTDLSSNLPERRIEEISIVHEVSVVNFPAYQDTSLQARGEVETSSALEEAKANLEKFKKLDNLSKKELEREKLKYFYLMEDLFE